MIANVHAAFRHVEAAAQHTPEHDRWRTVLDCIFGVMVENHPQTGARQLSAGKDDPA